MTTSLGPYAFVTVGSTGFDKLIETVLTSPVLLELKRRGIMHVILQIGRGSDWAVQSAINSASTPVPISYYRFKPSLCKDMYEADLVISHAGSGTVLESLSARRKLVVIVNEDLMDNHQVELAEQLGSMGHLAYGTCKSLQKVLEDDKTWGQLQDYPPADPTLFADYVDRHMGFEPRAPAESS